MAHLVDVREVRIPLERAMERKLVGVPHLRRRGRPSIFDDPPALVGPEEGAEVEAKAIDVNPAMLGETLVPRG